MIEKISSALSLLRETNPLVLCLTNYVTMDFMANSLLALGASPIMSCEINEIEELIKMSSAVIFNIGTLDAELIEKSRLAVKFAKQHKIPLVLDPAGVGASMIRTHIARELMFSADILRGNASEIMSLLDSSMLTRGVESTQRVDNAKDSANRLSHSLKCTVVVSGEEDYITDGVRQALFAYGSPMMCQITGMGCTLTSVIAAFRSVIADSFEAAAIATAYYGLCGNLSHGKTAGPGSFRLSFIDELYSADFAAMQAFVTG